MTNPLEPMLVSGMRRHPTGEAIHKPDAPIGKMGTSTRGFLSELDEWAAQIWEAGRESVGYDMTRPTEENGMKPASKNPYRR